MSTCTVQKYIFAIICAIALGIVFWSCAIWVGYADCSVYKYNSAAQCRCISGNGDEVRAAKCRKVYIKKKRAALKASCLRRCYDDCEKCDNI
jgi:hypothetical protein